MAMLEANVRFRAQSEASTAPEPVGTIGTAPAASASGNGAAPPGE
jgi:hypothetical protein